MPKYRVETIEHRVYYTAYSVEVENADEARDLVAGGEGEELKDRYERTDERDILEVKKEESSEGLQQA